MHKHRPEIDILHTGSPNWPQVSPEADGLCQSVDWLFMF